MSFKKRCFVIMPFSQTTDIHTEEYWTNHYEEFLKPIIEEIGEIDVSRSEALRGDLLNRIIFNLVNSDIVIADLTDSNPNVYWELGIRHSFKSGTILIKDNNYKIPFDLSKIGILSYYPEKHIKNEKFRRQLQKSIKDCCDNPEYVDSYVLEVISGRGSIYEIISKEETSRKIQALQFEYQLNKELHDKLFQYVKKNIQLREQAKKDPKNKKKILSEIRLQTNRMLLPSIELLLTTRYVDEDQAWFEILATIHANLAAINGQMSAWGAYATSRERWFINAEKGQKNTFKSYENLIKYFVENYYIK